MIVLCSCGGGKMPLQGVSTANYAYRPPVISEHISGSTYNGNTYSSFSRSMYTRPENAFRSMRESANNIESIFRSYSNIENILN